MLKDRLKQEWPLLGTSAEARDVLERLEKTPKLFTVSVSFCPEAEQGWAPLHSTLEGSSKHSSLPNTLPYVPVTTSRFMRLAVLKILDLLAQLDRDFTSLPSCVTIQEMQKGGSRCVSTWHPREGGADAAAAQLRGLPGGISADLWPRRELHRPGYHGGLIDLFALAGRMGSGRSWE